MMNQEIQNLDTIQQEVAAWAQRNFGKKRTASNRLVGVTEEFGELVIPLLEELVPVLHVARQIGILSHHHLKEDSGIRGTPELHQAKARDAIGDIILFLIDYCELRGWSLWDIIQETWKEVQQRNWIDDPLSGGIKRYAGQEGL